MKLIKSNWRLIGCIKRAVIMKIIIKSIIMMMIKLLKGKKKIIGKIYKSPKLNKILSINKCKYIDKENRENI